MEIDARRQSVHPPMLLELQLGCAAARGGVQLQGFLDKRTRG